jgi:hypothetical protein
MNRPINGLGQSRLGRAANGSPGELGLASMEIIEAACASARSNRCEKIRHRLQAG